jgi:serine/threonine protein kinase
VTARLNGRYELREKLGQGSQGETFAAIDHGREATLTDKWDAYVGSAKGKPAKPRGNVAIKCFRIGQATAWKDVELAEREARTLASLDHPRLPKYFDHFEEGGVLYLVMEKIDGESLAAGRRAFGADEVVRMMKDVAEALRYLHRRAPPIVHRDVKPANVLRRPDGSYVLVDLGAVRDRLKAGGSTVVGTFGFMAPEQFQGRASPKSDVYGLGATAIAMLTGEEPETLPHEGLGIDVARAVPRGTPASLVRALEAMLEPDPDRRIDSVDDAIAMLSRSPKPKKTKKTKSRRKRTKPPRKQRAPLLPRLLARLGLLIAWLIVSLVVGGVVPLVLVIFSLLFGAPLRRAARACAAGASKSRFALGRASAWLSGHSPDPRIRVAAAEEEGPRIAEATGENADAWIDATLREQEQTATERERMRAHARPPKTRHWGR